MFNNWKTMISRFPITINGGETTLTVKMIRDTRTMVLSVFIKTNDNDTYKFDVDYTADQLYRAFQLINQIVYIYDKKEPFDLTLLNNAL